MDATGLQNLLTISTKLGISVMVVIFRITLEEMSRPEQQSSYESEFQV